MPVLSNQPSLLSIFGRVLSAGEMPLGDMWSNRLEEASGPKDLFWGRWDGCGRSWPHFLHRIRSMSVIKMEARDTGHQASTRPINMCTKEGLSKSPFDQRRHDYVLILRCGVRFSRRCTTDWSGVPGASQRDFCIAPNVSSSFRPTRRPAADFFLWEPGRILTSRNTFPGWKSTTGARLDLDFDPGTMRGKF